MNHIIESTAEAFMVLDALDQEQPTDPPDCGEIDVCVDCGSDCEPDRIVLCATCMRARRRDELNEVLRDIARPIK